MNRQLILLLCGLMLLISFTIKAQDCSLKNKTFQFGERIDYTIYYHLAGMWVGAGEVYFAVDSAKIGKKKYWHFDSYGETYSKYDWIYKVSDHYQAYTNPKNFVPLRFKREVNEGSDYAREDYLFDYNKGHAITLRQLEEDGPFLRDTVSLEQCSHDVLTMIYYTRNVDFANANVNDKIPINIFIDNAAHDSYIRYLGRKKVKVKGLGTYNTIMFSPLLIEGSIFNAGENMTVYVTDDKNRIPILIETPILVGSIRARVKSMKGLRHPVESKVLEE
jgi:hypothetical protein